MLITDATNAAGHVCIHSHIIWPADNAVARLLLPCRYDMKYDIKYAYFRFVEELAASIGLITLQHEPQQAPESDGSDSTEEGEPLCV
jgi:hypothetical protein